MDLSPLQRSFLIDGSLAQRMWIHGKCMGGNANEQWFDTTHKPQWAMVCSNQTQAIEHEKGVVRSPSYNIVAHLAGEE